MEGLQVIEKSIPCAKCPNQLLKYQAASKQIKNAINPLMLGQKSPPWFQKHGASCRSGIIVNLCYYKCASCPLLCFHTVGKREDLELCGFCAAEQIEQPQFSPVCFSGNVGKAGDGQEVPIPGQTLLLGKTRVGVTAKEFGFPDSRGRSINHPETKARLLPASRE